MGTVLLGCGKRVYLGRRLAMGGRRGLANLQFSAGVGLDLYHWSGMSALPATRKLVLPNEFPLAPLKQCASQGQPTKLTWTPISFKSK